MNNGRTLKIFLVDGAPNGLLTAEIMNWTGHVLTGPRSRLSELVQRPEGEGGRDDPGVDDVLAGVDAAGRAPRRGEPRGLREGRKRHRAGVVVPREPHGDLLSAERAREARRALAVGEVRGVGLRGAVGGAPRGRLGHRAGALEPHREAERGAVAHQVEVQTERGGHG